jgi:hypothetical protein
LAFAYNNPVTLTTCSRGHQWQLYVEGPDRGRSQGVETTRNLAGHNDMLLLKLTGIGNGHHERGAYATTISQGSLAGTLNFISVFQILKKGNKMTAFHPT